MPVEVIEAEIKKHPDLASYEQSKIFETHDTLTRAGFTPDNALKIICTQPSVVRLQPKKLSNNLEYWHGFGFSRTQFITLMVQCPELLEITDEYGIRKRIGEIKTFAGSAKNIWRLIMSSPNILTDNINVINKKANYLINDMDVDVTDAVKSAVFAYSLNKIQCRHMLLVRLGIYKPRNKNAGPLDANKNPRVARIFDSSNKGFAFQICGISLAELHTFIALYTRELEENRQDAEEEEEELSDAEDDDNDDDDDEEFDASAKPKYDSRYKDRYNKFIKK